MLEEKETRTFVRIIDVLPQALEALLNKNINNNKTTHDIADDYIEVDAINNLSEQKKITLLPTNKSEIKLHNIVEIEKTDYVVRANDLLGQGYVLIETAKKYYDGVSGTETVCFILGRPKGIEQVEEENGFFF